MREEEKIRETDLQWFHLLNSLGKVSVFAKEQFIAEMVNFYIWAT